MPGKAQLKINNSTAPGREGEALLIAALLEQEYKNCHGLKGCILCGERENATKW